VSPCRLSRASNDTSLTRSASLALAATTAIFLVGMVATFVWQSLPIWRHEGLAFLTTNRWFHREHEFGALAMVYGTAIVSAIALLLAGPIGVGAAIFTAEVLPAGLRLPCKVAIELLAGIPSVIYGLLGVLLLRPWMYRLLEPFDPLSGDTLLTAGVLLAVMILPTVTTLADDALRGVPASHRAAARGLGLSRAETVIAVAVPQARRGLVAALLLALGRALGEGIAVFLVIGRQDNQWPDPPWSPRPLVEAGQTLNTKLVGAETNLAFGDSLHGSAMVGLGVVLLAMSVAVTATGMRLARGKGPRASRT